MSEPKNKQNIENINVTLNDHTLELAGSSNYLDGYGINVTKYGIKNDNSESIVSTMNDLITQGNNNFFFPPGQYKVDGLITLTGACKITCIGAIFNIYHTNDSAFKLTGRHKIRGMAFYYPNQDMTGANIIVYPAAINSSSALSYSIMDDINLGNAYIGIDLSNGLGGGMQISNVYGYPLYRGIIISNTIDILHIDRVHFNPNFYGVPALALKRFVWTTGVAVELGRYDFGNVNKVFAWGYKAVFKLTLGSIGGAVNNVKLTNWTADACDKLAIFTNHDGGVGFYHGTGTFYYPYGAEDPTPPTQSTNFLEILGGGSDTYSSKYVDFCFNRVYRAEKHGIWASNPIKCIGNEFMRYANSYAEVDPDVIDCIQLNANSDGSIIIGNVFDGKDKAQNRCIAINSSGKHKINNNQYFGWKSTNISGYDSTCEINGMYHFSTSADRPTSGRKYVHGYDMQISKAIWFDGVNWVDATGSIV